MAGTPPQPPTGGSDNAAISQADIDALLAGASSAPDAPTPPVADSGEISQADIDALMNAAASGEMQPAAPPSAVSDPRLDSLGRPFDEAAAAMQAAMDEERGAAATTAQAPQVSTEKFSFPDLGGPSLGGVDARKLSMLSDVKLRVKVELGRTRMLVEDVLRLGEGSVVELDKLAGDPVDVFANDRLIARGEVLVLNDNFCVRVSEVVSNDPHRVNV